MEYRVKGVELDRDPAPIALDSLQGAGDDFPDDRLTRAAEVDELSVVVGEDGQPVGLEHATHKRMSPIERCRRELGQMLDCVANGRHLHLVLAPKRGEDVKLGEIEERNECRRRRRRNLDERQMVAPSHRPVADRGRRHREIVRRFGDRVRGKPRVGRSLHCASLGRIRNEHPRRSSRGRM